jgi:hypothetical protein
VTNYSYVSHEVDGSGACYMTVRVVTVTRRWIFWKRRTERTRDVFRKPYGSSWHWMSNGQLVDPYFYELDELFDGFVDGIEARAKYEALLDSKIAGHAPASDPGAAHAKVVSLLSKLNLPVISATVRKKGER